MKPERCQSSEFLAFLHTKTCSVPSCAGKPIEAHHVISRKWKSGSDFRAVPLCSEHHTEGTHKIGWTEFQSKHGIDFITLSFLLFEQFAAFHGLANPYKVEHKKVSRGTAKPRKSKKVNRVPFTKKFIPINERDL